MNDFLKYAPLVNTVLIPALAVAFYVMSARLREESDKRYISRAAIEAEHARLHILIEGLEKRLDDLVGRVNIFREDTLIRLNTIEIMLRSNGFTESLQRARRQQEQRGADREDASSGNVT